MIKPGNTKYGGLWNKGGRKERLRSYDDIFNSIAQPMFINLWPGDECYVLAWFGSGGDSRRRVVWRGETHLPEGCCNTQYLVYDLDTDEMLSYIGESWIEKKDW